MDGHEDPDTQSMIAAGKSRGRGRGRGMCTGLRARADSGVRSRMGWGSCVNLILRSLWWRLGSQGLPAFEKGVCAHHTIWEGYSLWGVSLGGAPKCVQLFGRLAWHVWVFTHFHLFSLFFMHLERVCLGLFKGGFSLKV